MRSVWKVFRTYRMRRVSVSVDRASWLQARVGLPFALCRGMLRSAGGLFPAGR